MIRNLTLTPLKEQPHTVKLILEFADLYEIRKWRRAEEYSRFKITEQNIDYATEKMWDQWKLSGEGLKARSVFQRLFIRSPIFQQSVVDSIFNFCYAGMWKFCLKFPICFFALMFESEDDHLRYQIEECSFSKDFLKLITSEKG